MVVDLGGFDSNSCSGEGNKTNSFLPNIGKQCHSQGNDKKGKPHESNHTNW